MLSCCRLTQKDKHYTEVAQIEIWVYVYLYLVTKNAVVEF